MTKYCPACESEYQDTVKLCSDDKERLLDAPALKLARERSVDIYASANEIEAKLIMGILGDAGIASQLFRPQISQLPMLGETHYVLVVHSEDKEAALEHINLARSDGILSDTGLFLQ